MGLQIEPENRSFWSLRATISKTATKSNDGKVFIPDFDVGRDFTSQFIAVGITVKASRDNWRNGGYLSQEFSFPSVGYSHNRKAFNRTQDLLINDVSILALPPLSDSTFRLRYFPPTYFSDVKLQVWEYVGVQTDLLLRDLANFLRNAPADLLINLPQIEAKLDLLLANQKQGVAVDLSLIYQKLDDISLKLGIPQSPKQPTEDEILFFLFN